MVNALIVLHKMTLRIPCQECGAEILPATAEATGGVCMACKQGIRKNIEASKKYYEEQRKYNPMRELWTSLVKRVHQTADGFDGMSADEQIYYAVGILDGEIYNGGMLQYFWNSSGGLYRSAIDGLLELKAMNALRLLTEAAKLLFEDQVPEDRETRCAAIRKYPDDATTPTPEWVVELDRIDKAYCEDPDGLGERLERFARDRGLVQPFEKEEVEQ